MKFFLVSLVFLLSLGQLQRIQVTNNIAFYLHDLLIIGFLLKKLFAGNLQIKKIIENTKKIIKKQKKITLLILILIFSSWILAFLEHRFDLRAILYLGRLITYCVFVVTLQKQLKNKSWLWRMLSFNFLLLGFLQYFLLPDLRFLIYEGYDDHLYRLTSTILDPAFTGLIFTLNLNYYLWQKKKNYLLIILFALGLLLTYSRASYLAFFLSSLLIIFLNKEINKKIVLFILLCFCMTMPFLPKKSGGDGVNLLRTISIQKRISNDQEILQNMTGSQWLIGQGLFIPTKNRISTENIPSHSHFADNFLVFLISNLGIIGGTILLISFFKLAIKSQSNEQKILTTSLITHSMFNYGLTQSFVVLIFLGLYFSQD